jgi:putative tricarboxylic transport membrane protein
MSAFIKHPKDFFAGLMYASTGIGAIMMAQEYTLGSSVRMGPGYFPTLLGAFLTLIGVVSMIRSFLHPGEAIKAFCWKEIFLVLGSVALFGVLVRGAGLAPSLMLMVLVSARASEKFKLGTALALAVASSVFSVLVFVKGLGLPLPIIGPWFGM